MEDILLEVAPKINSDITLTSLDSNFGNQADFKSEPRNVSVSFGSFTVDSFYVGYAYSELMRIFYIPNFQIVSKFINQNKFLKTALVDIEKAIRVHFTYEKLRIEFYEDTEGELSDELAIYIMTNEKPKKALAKLDSFDQSFWFKKIDEYEDYVTVNLEYI